jgi:hypothetical protein
MLKFIDGFDQYQGQSGQSLLSSLTSAGYTVSSGLAMADGRKSGSFALELQVSAGSAGDAWSSRSNNIKQDLYGIASNADGRFVSVGNNGAAVGSDDNIMWLPVITGVSAHLRDIVCHGSTWVLVGYNSTIMRSTDGKNFVARPAPEGVNNANLEAVATDGNGKWMAVGAVGAASAIFFSLDDGVTWSNIIGVGTSGNLCVEWGAVNWVVGGGNGQILTSPDGVTWTSNNVGSTDAVMALAFDGGSHWLAATGKDIRRSVSGGSTWALLVANVTGFIIQGMEYADGRWMLVSLNGQVRTSLNESDWESPNITGIGTTPLYDVCATQGARAGWALCGAVNPNAPLANRTAVVYVSLAPPTKVTRTFITASSKVVFGFAHRSTARGRILTIKDVFDMDWPVGIEINDVNGVAVPARNVWYYYELEIDKVDKTVKLYINNVLDLTAPLADSITTRTDFEVTWMSENGAVSRLDDIYVLDHTSPAGETLVERLGPISMSMRLPTADLLANWTTSSGTIHWPLVSMLPPSTESFIRSSTSGAVDLFTSSDPLPPEAGTVDAPIIAVGVMALAMKGDIDNRQIGLLMGDGANQMEVLDPVLSTVPEYSQGIFEKAPGGVDWDVTNITTTPFGVVVRP